MNLEEKATNASMYGRNKDESECLKFGFKQGYKECKSDLLQFLKANPKASIASLIDHLESLK